MLAVARHTPYLRQLLADRQRLLDAQGRYPIGHYYSPIPSRDEVRLRSGAFYEKRKVKDVPGVDLNEAGQLSTLAELGGFHAEQPCVGPADARRRYRPDNASYGPADAIILYAMIRRLKPKRIIDVGCGNSSCVILDTNERFFDNAIACTFIDPNIDRLESLLRPEDLERHERIATPVQDVDTDRFVRLSANDMLIIDNSHISKLGSDVNHVFTEILPCLGSGVHVHIHDIFYPFDYPGSWTQHGIYFNEAYVLRAFLQYNTAFEIAYWNQFTHLFHLELLRRHLPLCADDPGAAIWLRRGRGSSSS